MDSLPGNGEWTVVLPDTTSPSGAACRRFVTAAAVTTV
jgi:hypothetical protein